MKQLIIILSLLVPIFSFSQAKVLIVKEIKVKEIDKYWPHVKFNAKGLLLSNGDTVAENTALKLGKGSLPNGDYNYIATPSNTMEAKLKRTTKLKDIWITEIRVKGNKKDGYKYIIIGEGNNLIQLEDAIIAGEIIL